ncbi:phage baseplate assembly protein V [Actinoplanes sp. NPDC026623]|uniref:phage baseplate assembly protein V n=1 Tax=Actinoplanes sp. NPDC026623 TaxID=3155610 RepID=UPI0033EF237F
MNRERAGTPVELERIVAGLVEQVERRFWGKYRGRVVDNEDPARLGRLRVSVPSVLGPDVVTGWASPCAPYGGAADQGMFFIPERKAGVWIEFEEGDLEFPIWVGTYWSRPDDGSEVPLANAAADASEAAEPQQVPTRKTIKTLKGHTLQFEDADKAEAILLYEGVNGHLVTLDKNGIAVLDGFGNEVVLSKDGIRLTDLTGNEISMTGDALTIIAKKDLTIDATGKKVQIIASAIDLTKG